MNYTTYVILQDSLFNVETQGHIDVQDWEHPSLVGDLMLTWVVLCKTRCLRASNDLPGRFPL